MLEFPALRSFGDRQGLSSQRFWVTTFDSYSLEKTTSILEKIFWSPKNYDQKEDRLGLPSYSLAD
jgi:hypothetical protein